MPSKPRASRIILEVERAASDLRRGEAVILKNKKGTYFRVSSLEHHPKNKAVSDPRHAAVKLMKLAGLLPGAVVEPLKILNNADLLVVSEEAIAAYPASLAATLEKVSEASVPLFDAEDARVIAFRARFGHEEHLAVIIGNYKAQKVPYVRIHSSCVTGDVFGSLRCDCGEQLKKAVLFMHKQGGGIILYLGQEGRGIGIANKLRAYQLQDNGMDTVEANVALGFEADERDFAIAATMLKALAIKKVRLLTNNPVKLQQLELYGIKVEKREPLVTEANRHNRQYIATKARKMGHQF